jgi:uncharacterized protein YjbI with pentapeptide repeats
MCWTLIDSSKLIAFKKTNFKQKLMLKYYYQIGLIFLLLYFPQFVFPDENNPTTYPYGAVILSKKVKTKLPTPPLIFNKNATFINAKFNTEIDLLYPQFLVKANFEGARFNNKVRLQYPRFYKMANFKHSQFKDINFFWHAHFDTLVTFEGANFDTVTQFSSSTFRDNVIFEHATFNNVADFSFAYFQGVVNFTNCRFRKSTSFQMARIDSFITFNNTYFNGNISFDYSRFGDNIDFRYAYFDSLAEADFALAEIGDTIFVGRQQSNNVQRFDFLRTKFLEAGKRIIFADTARGITKKVIKYSGCKILIFGPVALKIQSEKFKYIELCDTLDYYSKKDIISTLKTVSFDEEKYKKEKFELDYIFAKSTLYQKESPSYEKYSVLHPKSWWVYFYNLSMGMGYRPFRLIYLVLLLLIGFGLGYAIIIPERIYKYIIQTEEKKRLTSTGKKSNNSDKPPLIDKILYCLYFSTMLLFTLRLKRDLLIYFNTKEKLFVVGEWFLGFLIYVYFLWGAESGSIIQNLKEFFIGY